MLQRGGGMTRDAARHGGRAHDIAAVPVVRLGDETAVGCMVCESGGGTTGSSTMARSETGRQHLTWGARQLTRCIVAWRRLEQTPPRWCQAGFGYVLVLVVG